MVNFTICTIDVGMLGSCSVLWLQRLSVVGSPRPYCLPYLLKYTYTSALQGEGERAASAKIRESFEITHVFLDPGCHIFKAISRSSIKGRKIGLCVLASIATFTSYLPLSLSPLVVEASPPFPCSCSLKTVPKKIENKTALLPRHPRCKFCLECSS